MSPPSGSRAERLMRLIVTNLQMLRVRIAAPAAAVALIAAGCAAKAPSLPQASGHRTVTVVARGVPTPTEFAVSAGRLFVAGYGDEHNPKVAGGVYLLAGGKAIRVPGSPQHVFGLAAAKNTLYVSTSQALLAWSGWNGTRFQKTRVVRTPDGYGSFKGPAVGPDGLIYVGADPRSDPRPPTVNTSDAFVSVDPATGSTDIIATGIRQPWMPVFLPGHALPLVSGSTRTTSARIARATTSSRSSVARTTVSRSARRPRERVRTTPSRSSNCRPIPPPWGSAT
jgi:glucose/arabinose dehydrogenase